MTILEHRITDFGNVQRNAEWCRLYVEEGKSSLEIADAYGVSRERVCQILRKENIIERQAQRRRLARELEEQDRAAIKAERAEIERRIIEIVRSGKSIAAAAAEVGIKVDAAGYICTKHGIASKHGRRDFSARIARLRELAVEGRSLSQIAAIVSAEEGRTVGYQWIWKNCPEICPKHRRANAKSPRENKPKRETPSEPKWTDDRVSQLIGLWLGGASAQQIADIFGGEFTRNAIIGKIGRLRGEGKLRPTQV